MKKHLFYYPVLALLFFMVSGCIPYYSDYSGVHQTNFNQPLPPVIDNWMGGRVFAVNLAPKHYWSQKKWLAPMIKERLMKRGAGVVRVNERWDFTIFVTVEDCRETTIVTMTVYSGDQVFAVGIGEARRYNYHENGKYEITSYREAIDSAILGLITVSN